MSCCICLEECSASVVLCEHGHGTCETCLETYVLTKAEALAKTDLLAAKAEAAVATNDQDKLAELGGACFCPMHNTYGRCEAPPYDDRTLAASTSKETFAEYVRAKALLPAAQRVQKVVQARQEMSVLLPNARQCGRCSFGPVQFHGCDDLTTHHGEVRRGDAIPIDNSCRRCGWFAPHISQWPVWDPTAVLLGGGDDPLQAVHAQAEALVGTEAGDEEAAAARVVERQQQAIRFRQEREERRRAQHEERMARHQRERERHRELLAAQADADRDAQRAEHERRRGGLAAAAAAARDEQQRMAQRMMARRGVFDDIEHQFDEIERLMLHPPPLPPLPPPPRLRWRGVEEEADVWRLERDRDRALERELDALEQRELDALERDVVGMERAERMGALERELAQQTERRVELERQRAAAEERRRRREQRLAEALRAPEPAGPLRDPPAAAGEGAVARHRSVAAAVDSTDAAAPPRVAALPRVAVPADAMVRRLNGELRLARPSGQAQEDRRDAMALFVRLTGLVADGGAARMYLDDAAWDVEAAVRAAVQGAAMPSPSGETPPPQQPEHQQQSEQQQLPMPPQDGVEQAAMHVVVEVVGEAQ